MAHVKSWPLGAARTSPRLDGRGGATGAIHPLSGTWNAILHGLSDNPASASVAGTMICTDYLGCRSRASFQNKPPQQVL